MGQVLLLLVVALTVAAVVFGVTVLVSGRDPGLAPAEPDGRAVPLPGSRPLHESDVAEARFDTALRGYRMAQVDQAMRRAAYDIGYKSELIGVLEAEVAALREGRTADADALRDAREASAGASPAAAPTDAVSSAGDTLADASDAEAGVAAAPAAAAVEDEAVLPTPAPATPAGGVVPVAAPVDQEPTDREVPVRPPADPTSSPAASAPATDPTGKVGRTAQGPAAAADDSDSDGARERGAVVRSERA